MANPLPLQKGGPSANELAKIKNDLIHFRRWQLVCENLKSGTAKKSKKEVFDEVSKNLKLHGQLVVSPETVEKSYYRVEKDRKETDSENVEIPSDAPVGRAYLNELEHFGRVANLVGYFRILVTESPAPSIVLIEATKGERNERRQSKGCTALRVRRITSALRCRLWLKKRLTGDGARNSCAFRRVRLAILQADLDAWLAGKRCGSTSEYGSPAASAPLK